MNKRLKIGIYVFSGVFLVLAAIAVVVICIFRQAFPQTRGTIAVEGIDGPVEILRDADGVPHLNADSMEDLFFGQGFVHAQDRFWQMEFSRHMSSGRLSELFGDIALEWDSEARTYGFNRVAKREYELMDSETKRYVDAYARGVNAYIADRKPGKLGLEFSLLSLSGLDFDIEPWSGENSLTWAKMLALMLSRNMSSEALFVSLLKKVGLHGNSDFFSKYRDDMPYSIADEELALSGFDLNEVRDASPRIFSTSAAMGTNCWVISGALSTTGMPILANDTHLLIEMPSIWYEVGLEENGEDKPNPLHVRGFSFPGVPGIIIGHNSRIAWGLSNVGGDVQDLYLERLNPEDPNQYMADGEWTDMSVAYETINVHDRKDPHVLPVRLTRHGPIVSDDVSTIGELSSYTVDPSEEFPDNLKITAVSLKWTALQPTRMLKAVFLLNQARNFQEFRSALSFWDVPGQNAMYADVEGNIGFQTAGRFPIRTKGDGTYPVPGWTDDYEWVGFIPFEELPWIYNPPKGYIVNANNPITSARYPHFLGSDFTFGYRAKRIEDLIASDTDGISVQETVSMQGDTLSIGALEIIPYLAALSLDDVLSSIWDDAHGKAADAKSRDKNNELKAAKDMLLGWDGRYDRKSPEAALYGFFWVELVEETLKDEYPPSKWPPGDQGRLQNAFTYLLQEPNNSWWDDITTPDKVETRDDVLKKAFLEGYSACVDRLGDNPESWKWEDLHTARFVNQSLGQSGISIVERIFNRGPFGVPGSNTEVFATGWHLSNPFDVEIFTSMRQIIDLSDLDASLMIHSTGQSGHPGHRHYDDFIEPWRDLEYHPNRWTREEIEMDSKERLILMPAGESSMPAPDPLRG